jgi:hypothetical protein
MNIKSVSTNINTSTGLTSELADKWAMVVPKLKEAAIVREIEMTPVQAEKYKGDLHGLFKNEMSMRETHIYPHILVNGYDSSSCFDGTNLKLYILDESKVEVYYKLLTKKNKKVVTS